MGDLPQQFVPGGMAEVVVDRLEAIQIDEQHPHHGRRTTRAAQHLCEAVRQQHTIRQAGQGIEIGLPPDHVVVELAFGAIDEQHHEVADAPPASARQLIR